MRAAHEAATAQRAAGASIQIQQDAAAEACSRTARSFGIAGAASPCFMCGDAFTGLRGHWQIRTRPSGVPAGSTCALAWGGTSEVILELSRARGGA